MKNSGFLGSVRNAARGLVAAFGSERNVRIDIMAALYVAYFGYLCGIEAWAWAVCALAAALVLTAELLNTALEYLCDYLVSTYDERIRAVKDIAAGAVSVASLGAVFAGIAVFARAGRLTAMLDRLNSQYWLLLPLPLFILIVRRRK